MGFELNELIERMPECARELIHSMTGATVFLSSEITGARSTELAEKSELTFWKGDARDLKTKSRVTIVAAQYYSEEHPNPGDSLFIWSEKPRLLLAYLLQPFLAYEHALLSRRAGQLYQQPFTVSYFDDCEIGIGTRIGYHTVVSNAFIGEDCRIWHNVTIGGDGFSFEVDERNGNVVKLPHFGKVIIGNRVEIQSGAQIVRGSLGDTIIEDDVKIDQLVHVAHNCHIKRGALIIAGSMLGGSVTVGEYSWVAPETAILNGVDMGRCSMTGLGAVVTKDVADNELVIGVPAKKLRDRYYDGHPMLDLGGNGYERV